VYLSRLPAARSVAAWIVAPPSLIRLAPEVAATLIPRISLLVVGFTTLLKILSALSISLLEISTRTLLVLLI
jgi:hypothetical protein